MTERKKQLLEVLGGVLLVAGLSVIHIALGLVVAGVLLIALANFGDVKASEKEANDAGTVESA